jgi:transcriptional antiterminator RfaH
MKRWYVVNTLAHQERRAEANLRRQGFETWLPEFRRRRRHARRIDMILAPLFPAYLFVRLDVETERWRSINGTFGVVRLLCDADMPKAVPEALIDDLMHRRDEAGSIILPSRKFVAGESIRVAAGPFADLEGLFEEMSGRDRVFLLFNLLGRKVRASVPVVELAA